MQSRCVYAIYSYKGARKILSLSEKNHCNKLFTFSALKLLLGNHIRVVLCLHFRWKATIILILFNRITCKILLSFMQQNQVPTNKKHPMSRNRVDSTPAPRANCALLIAANATTRASARYTYVSLVRSTIVLIYSCISSFHSWKVKMPHLVLFGGVVHCRYLLMLVH